MTFVIDIDNTILISEKLHCIECNRIVYNKALPIQTEIDKINKLYEKGHIIILWTGRGWDSYKITKMQLTAIGIKYNELVMGKVQGIYIDADSYKSIKEFTGK